ncbi:gephyrin-like molybdotransferase Glp [Rhodothalassium salexigens]|nr:gephyrin-like molybdotransferase Glp [Rhodothalassium salexigens]MBB4209958.1 molybdopterin molybdotransferase [Rhodothalassium salexigens DSM 2132]MBK1637670.1 hypothetical protein [Rhodothalassium salexigens DSM 2132]
MRSVDDAHTAIQATLAPLPAEWVTLDAAHGRVLAEPVVARRTQPPAALSAMDGYAVRAAEAGDGAVLRVAGETAAGDDPGAPLAPQTARRIYTGAALPKGADAVLIQEHASPAGGRDDVDGEGGDDRLGDRLGDGGRDDDGQDGGRIRVDRGVDPGAHVRPRGQDFAAGQPLLAPGTRLGARHIALAAAGQVPWLAVHARPRVALLATGDELVRAGEPLGAHAIVDTVTPALAAQLRAAGAEVVALGIARDREAELAAYAGALARADLALTVGGASVGARDLIRSALGRAGLALDFWTIAMRPGKPLLFGRFASGTPLIGLPGNPVSALVCAQLFVLPAVDRLAGGDGRPPRPVQALAAHDLPAGGARQDYQRAALTTDALGQRWVRPLSPQDSAMLTTLAAADALLVRPAGAPAAATGTAVPVLPLFP